MTICFSYNYLTYMIMVNEIYHTLQWVVNISSICFKLHIIAIIIMYICERFTRAKVAQLPPASGLFLLLYISLYSRQGPASGAAISAALKAVQAARYCAHWQRRYRSGASRRRCPVVGFLFRFLGSLDVVYCNRAQEFFLLLAPKTKNDQSVPKRRCRASGHPAWRIMCRLG